MTGRQATGRQVTGRLAGRRILIVGGGSGIGLACVERFVREDARVAAVDRDVKRLDALRGRFPAEQLSLVRADVADETAIGAAVSAAAEAIGGLDGVVNAAGIDLVAPLDAMDLADWTRVMTVNLTGPMLVCRAAYPHLKAAGGGTIVNLSSGAGLSPLAERTAYCASKAGLQMFGKALAIEAARFDIRVNTVCPGAVETPLFRETIDGHPDSAERYEAVRQRYALKRVAEPRELADAVLWLTSAESSYVTGTAIAVDGGRTFH